ncbi:MAG: translocation/assembly module TamB domain-containing protein [Elainellaceae cyanobacterium]
MTNSSNERPPGSESGEPSLLRRVGTAAAVVSGVVILGTGAGLIAARYFVYERLAPIVENALSESLNRPLRLGEVEQFSLTGITFGGAEIPTTDTQSDYAVTETVQVGLNPVKIIARLVGDREVPISIRLVDSELFLVEGEDGWLQTELEQDEEDEEGPVSIVVEKVTVKNATVIANPRGSLDATAALEANDPDEDANDVDARADVAPDTSPDVDQGSIVPTEDEDGAPEIRLEPVVLEGIDAVADLRNEYKDIDFEASGALASGGEFDINGAAALENQRVRGTVRSSDVSLPVLAALLPLPLALEQGVLDSNVTVEYRGDSGQPPIKSLYFQGTAQLSDAIAQLDAAPQPIEDLNTRLRFDKQTILLEDTSLRYGEILVEATGGLDLQDGYAIDALVPEVTLAQLQETLNIPIPVEVAGAFEADAQVSGPLEQPVVTGNINNRGRIDLDRTAVDSLQAAFTFTPPLLTVESFRIVPTVGGEIVGDGTVNLEADGDVAANIDATIPADALAQDYGFSLPAPYQIGPLVADLEVFGPFDDIQAVAQWQLPQATYSGQGEISYGNNQLRLQNTQLQVEGGTVTAAGVAQLDQQTWQANVSADGLQTGNIAPQLQGLLTADVALSGSLDNLDLAAVNAQGTARLDDTRIQPVNGVALVDPGTYQTGFRWTGDGIQVDGFSGPNVRADGFIGLDPAAQPAITGFNLDATLENYELARLAPFLPDAARQQAQLRGRASYAGQVSGTLSAPQVDGRLALDGFGVNRFTFEDMAGPVQLGLDQGGRIALQGGGDRIEATVNRRYLPTNFLVQNGDASVSGETTGDTLTAELREFPLERIEYQPLGARTGAVRGVVSANVEANIANLSNPAAVASVMVTKPGLGGVNADLFTGEVTYRNSVVSLADGELALDDGRYALDGRLALAGTRPFEASVGVEEGKLETAVAALRLISPPDPNRGPAIASGDSDDLTTQDRELPASLPDQLAFIADFVERNPPQAQEQPTAVIPPLEDLSGRYNATLRASGQLGDILGSLDAEFALGGKDWRWGPYGRGENSNKVEVAGRLADTTLTLKPARFQSGDSSVAYSGSLGLTGQQSGTLEVEAVPVPLLQAIAASFVNLPVSLDGTLNALVQFDGSLVDPTVDGEVAIANAEVNSNPLEEVAAEFRYAQAQLDADARIVNQGAQRLVAEANIPYALPFMAVQPTSDQISVEASLQDEALTLLDVVTNDQLQWQGGNGLVRVDVSGTLEAPVIEGTAQFEDGAVAIALLNDPITDITGRAAFDLQKVEVGTLEAKLNGGNIQVQGGLPLFESEAGLPSELLVALEQVPVDVDVPTAIDIDFSATVDGEVVVTNAALEPVLGGEIALRDGRVDPVRGFVGGLGLLGGEGAGAEPEAAEEDEPEGDASTDRTEPEPDRFAVIPSEDFRDSRSSLARDEDEAGEEAIAFANRVGFNDLKVILADDLQVAGQPFFNVEAQGDLTVNGTLADLRPSGTLELISGWVNIYTTQFRLDRDEPNQVVLDPERGVSDPIIMATATADVREVDRDPIPPSSPFTSSEVADQSTVPSFGGFETVEVTARLDGPLSELDEHLELESQPSRSDDQLVALIGGGLVNQLAQGDTALALATYVGSGTFASFSNEVVDALGLDLFRIFPTTDIGDESNLPVNIGVEAGIDITRRLSVTALQLLGSTTPPQVGIRYRLTDEFQIRANTDLDEDNRAILEYRIRF